MEGRTVCRADSISRPPGYTILQIWAAGTIIVSLLVGCSPEENSRSVIDDLPVFTAETDLYIDDHSADLVPVGWMGVAPDGTIAVLQPRDRTIRFFDPEGRDLGRVGSQGDGPGEFEQLARAGWIGDTLWASDTQLRRVTLVSTTPEILTTLPPLLGARPRPGDEDRFPAYSMAFPFAMYPDRDQLLSVLMPTSESAEVGPDAHPLYRASSEGLIEQFVFDIPWDPEGTFRVTFEDGSAGAPVPFYPAPQWAVAPDGSRVGALVTDPYGPDGGTFLVSVYDSLGEQVFSRRYPYSGVPIPDRIVDSVLARMAERAPHPDLKRAYQTDVKDRAPPIYPPVERIMFGSDGRVWIGLHGGEEGKRWMILDEDGDPVGRVVLPHGFTLQVTGSDHIFGVERDPFDVESIVRYRLRDEVGG